MVSRHDRNDDAALTSDRKTMKIDGRDRILARIRAGLAINGELLEAQGNAIPPSRDHGPFLPTDLDVVEQFRAELEALHAHVHVCDGPAAALEQVFDLIDVAGALEVIGWAERELPLPDLLPRLRDAGIAVVENQVLGRDRTTQYATLEPVPVCITGVDAAIAESGTMLLLSGVGRGRLASLLPPMHIALLPADRIFRTLPEAFAALQTAWGDRWFRDRSNLTLITGPSRTADIEQTLTLGVHGPRDVHAIVIR
jgi:L-lactate dehydrogenase complex protein LldG